MLTGVFTEPPAPVVVMSPETVQLSPRARLLVGIIVDVLTPDATGDVAVNAVTLLLHKNDSLEASLVSALVTVSLKTTLIPLPSFDTMRAPVAGVIDNSDAVGFGIGVGPDGGVVDTEVFPASPPPPPPPQLVSAIAAMMTAHFVTLAFFMTVLLRPMGIDNITIASRLASTSDRTPLHNFVKN